MRYLTYIASTGHGGNRYTCGTACAGKKLQDRVQHAPPDNYCLRNPRLAKPVLLDINARSYAYGNEGQQYNGAGVLPSLPERNLSFWSRAGVFPSA
jgi:hypothetical protein